MGIAAEDIASNQLEMKALKPAAHSLGTLFVIFFGAMFFTGCQASTNRVQESSSTVPTPVTPALSASPKVVKPTVKAEVKPSPINTPVQTPSPEAAQPTPVPEETPAPSQEESSGYVAGTCKELRAQGLSNFRPGNPNYTEQRDRDQDGVACES